jgi:flagellar biosynthesis protein FliR
MIDVSVLSLAVVQKYLLIAIRVGTLFAIAPLLGSGQIPAMTKIIIGLVLALILYPVVHVAPQHLPCPLSVYVIYILQEFMVGLVIGFATMLFLNGIYLAGQIIDMQIGFSIVNVIDPLSNVQTPVIGQLYYIVAILIFLTINGHHLLILALAKSFTTVPVAGFHYSGHLVKQIIQYSADLWSIAFQIGAPVIAALFLATVALGIIARTVPQMNVFIVGFPLNIALGLLVVGLTFSYFLSFTRTFYTTMFRDIQTLVALMGGR